MALLETALQDLEITVEYLDHTLSGFKAQAVVQPEQIRPACRALDTFGFFLETVTAIDWIREEIIQGVYLFNHYEKNTRFKIMTAIDRNKPVLPSIGSIYPGAVWHERETGEFFGIDFEGSKDTRCLLLPPETTFHPLRKDFTAPERRRETK